MEKEEIKEKLDYLKHEIEIEIGEWIYEHGYTAHYDILSGQMELLQGIYNLLGIDEE